MVSECSSKTKTDDVDCMRSDDAALEGASRNIRAMAIASVFGQHRVRGWAA
jgi:hypothetical protein